MLARRGNLSHPVAGEIELPLMVPAFSSKGFQLLSKGRGKARRDYSEISYELAEFGRNPSTSVLLSAYDLFFRHFDAPNLPVDRCTDLLRNSGVVFIDSGGYELIREFDTTEIKTPPYKPKEGYRREQYEQVLQELDSLEQPLPLIVANFDYDTRGLPLSQQISSAREFFYGFPKFLSDFILKPLTPDSIVVDPGSFSDKDFENLREFDIIGITEKELGSNLIDRIKRIAKLRKRLDDAKVSAPIHIWGGLDPVVTPLFFFAGAEIFDGVSWLRYAYCNGVAMNREVYLVLSTIGVDASRQLNHLYASLDNLTFLKNMTIGLQQWVDFEGASFDMFDSHTKESLERAYSVMTSKIEEIRRG